MCTLFFKVLFFLVHLNNLKLYGKRNLVRYFFRKSRRFKFCTVYLPLNLWLTRHRTNLNFCFRSLNTDRCQLEDPKAVEQIQWRLINALRVLAKRKNYRPEQRLWHILDRLTALRTMTEISKELDKQKCSWPVMKEHPLVLDILQSWWSVCCFFKGWVWKTHTQMSV